jgi:hypothetical protein
VNKKNRTALEDHVLEGHQFDSNRFEIVDRSNNYGKLKLLEMLHISTNDTVNKRSHQYVGLPFQSKVANLTIFY